MSDETLIFVVISQIAHFNRRFCVSVFIHSTFNGVCLPDTGGKSIGRPVTSAVWVKQESDATIPPVPDRPERGQSSVQRVHTNERRLP